MGRETPASLPFFVFWRMKRIEKLLLSLLLFFCFSACTDENENEKEDGKKQPVENTIIMFFPWSNNLKPCFIQNISDFKQVVQQHGSDKERYIVCFESTQGSVEIKELKLENGECVEDLIDVYNDPRFTTSEGITQLLDRIYAAFPSKKYSMTVGCHGTGWLPAGTFNTRAGSLRSDDIPETRYLGGTTIDFQIEISTFKEGITDSRIGKLEMILFDNCYMSNVEVAYELKDVCKYIVAYPTEVMAYGFPYSTSGKYMINGIDFEQICESFYTFYSRYERPCGTIATINCSGLDTLARFMKKVNQSVDTTVHVDSLQRYDGYDPIIFVDFQDYVCHLTDNPQFISELDDLMSVVIPFKKNTPTYYSTLGGQIPIAKYSGISISEPSEHSVMQSYKQTSWYKATH